MSMKKETIDDATLAAIKGPIGLKNSIETCLVNKLPSPTFQFIEDGTRFVVSGVGTVEISVSKKEIRASNKDLLQRAHQILRECAGTATEDPAIVPEDQNPENIPGGGKKKRKTRRGKKKTRRGKKNTRKSVNRRRQ